MYKKPISRPSPLLLTVRKLGVSAFVVVTFTAYVIHQRFAAPAASSSVSQLVVTPVPTTPPQFSPRGIISSHVVSQPSPPAPTTVSTERYRDGFYSGRSTDAVYGMVQVQATIQNGKLTNVEFLDYPNDRPTSVQINDTAMPYLMREAIQAQSAQVDVISGATLTSEAFKESLADALNQAKPS